MEIARELSSYASPLPTLDELYNFIMTGSTVTEHSEHSENSENSENPSEYPDGVYIVMADGDIVPFDTVDTADTSGDFADDAEKNAIGIGVKQGDRTVLVYREDEAKGLDIILTTGDDKTAKKCFYMDDPLEAVADFQGYENTGHLTEIGLNVEVEVSIEGEPMENTTRHVPSLGELHLIFSHLFEVNRALDFIGAEPIAGAWYHTSTEKSPAEAWDMQMRLGGLTWGPKGSLRARVRLTGPFFPDKDRIRKL